MAKLLVVDDSRLTRRIITGALKQAGHECVEATNGAEGLDAFVNDSFDCVMSDLLMPVMDGFELASAIRRIDTQIPVLVSTADIQESSRQRCDEIGVNRLLNKPLKAEQIQEAVAEALVSPAAQEV